MTDAPVQSKIAPENRGDPSGSASALTPGRLPRTVHLRSMSALTALLVLLAAGWLWQTIEPRPATRLSSAGLHLRLNPNTASARELELLPRIGPKLAQNIVAYRMAALNPPAFRTAADLDRVPRIGPVTVAELRPFLYFTGPAVEAPGDTAPISPALAIQRSPVPEAPPAARGDIAEPNGSADARDKDIEEESP